MLYFYLSVIYASLILGGACNSLANEMDSVTAIKPGIEQFLKQGFAFLDEPNCSLQFKIPELTTLNPTYTELKIANYHREQFTLFVIYDQAMPPKKLVGKITKLCLVPMLKNKIARGQVIQADQIYYQTVKLNNFTNIIKNADILIGKEAKQVILPDKVLSLNDIQGVTLISSGKEVDLIYRKKNLILQDKVQALEAGSEGEIIRIKNNRTNGVLKAKVHDAYTVVIEE